MPRSSTLRLRPPARGRAGLMGGTALQAAVLTALALPAAAQPAPNARPQGGVVTAGSATISTAPATTTINQASQRAAINWRSFDVGAQQTVQFNQPSSSAVALNRVVGPNPSQIAGRITANGQVVLTNQDGITFYKGSQVNTAGFVASAAGISNQNFMAGRMVFDQPAHAGARIDNAGTITVSNAGLAALVAPSVANSGVIAAKLGKVVLGGAVTHTLDMYGDGLVNIDVSGQVTHTAAGQTALVTNTGTIVAEGGTVALTARAADGVVQTLIQADGTIAAPSSGGRGGRVLLSGIGGDIAVTGKVLAQGALPGSKGGAIEVLPSGTVSIAKGARVDASGVSGGGTVAIGTTLARAAGGPSVKSATTSRGVKVAAGATIAASAATQGNGGRVTLLSLDSTQMAGSIVARGGGAGGDGGFIEVSGGSLGYSGTLDAGAVAGAPGSVLFDPATLTIQNGTGNLDSSLPTITLTTGGTASSDTVSASALQALAAGTNVTLEATTFIEVKKSVAFADNVSATLLSGGNLQVDSGVTLSTTGTGGLTLTAGGTLSLLTNSALSAPTVSLASGAGGISLGPSSIDASGLLVLAAGGNGAITQGANGTLAVGELTVATGGTVALGSSHNTFATLDGVSAGASLLVADSAGGLVVNGPVSATAVTLTVAAGDITLAGDLTGGTSARLTASAGNIVQTGGSITTGTLTAGASGSIDLSLATNAITNLGSVAAGGPLLVINGGTLTAAGPVSGTTVTLDAAAGDLVLSGSVSGSTNITLGADTGSIRQTGGTIATPVLRAIAAGSIALGSTLNAITEVAGAVASGGDLTLANGTDLALTGTESGQNVAVTVAAAGGTLALGSGAVKATVTTTAGGTATLITDRITEIANSKVDTGAAGTIALAPFSSTPVSLLGAAGLVLDATLFGELTAGTFVIGSTSSASSLVVSSAFSLGAGTLDLRSAGSITQLGALTVGTLSATGNGVTLDSALNAITSLGSVSAGSGAAIIVNALPLSVAGPISGGSVTLSALAGNLTLGGNVTGTGGVALTATFGSIVQTGGSIGAGTLSASASFGAIDLGATANAIGTLGAASALTSLSVVNGTAMTVAGPVSAPTVALSTQSGDLSLAGDIAGTTSVALAAASGSVSQTGGSITTPSLTGSASGGFGASATSNAIGAVGSVSAGGAVDIANGGTLTVTGPVGGDSVTLNAVTGNLLLAGDVAGTGAVVLAAGAGNVQQSGGSISAGTLSGAAAGVFLAGSTLNPISTIGSISAGTLAQVVSSTAMTVDGPVSAGTIQIATIAGDLTLAGAITGTASGTGLVQFVAVAGNIVQTGGSITGDRLLAAAANGIALGSTTNALGTVIGARAGTAGLGDLVLGNGTDLALTGTLHGDNVAITVAGGGTLALGSGVTAATLSAGSGDVSLAANQITEVPGTTITAPGTVTLAPATSSAISLAGTAGAHLLIDTTLLGAISATTLVIGDTATTTGISVDGAFAIAGHATTLDLRASGAITEPGGPLTAGVLLATGTGVTLDSALNAIGTLAGGSGGSGGFVLVNGTDLALAGTLGGQDIALTLAAGRTLALGTASLTASGDITLAADRITDAAGGTLVAPGTLAVGPVTPSAISLAGTAPTGLLLDSTFLDEVSTGRLAIGGATATAISIDGTANLAGVGTLDLATTGAITEPGGPLSVAVLTASSGTGITLGNALNAIGTLAVASAGAGNLTLVNGTDLVLAGAITGQVVTLQVAASGGTLALGTGGVTSSVSAASNAVLRADRITEIAGSSVIAPGTLTLAPNTANAVSLAGAAGSHLLIDARLLGEISTATLVVGDTATTTGIAIEGGVTLAGHAATLALLTSGSITEPGGVLSLGTLLATAGTGIALGSTLNAIGTVAGAAAGTGSLTLVNATDLTLAGTESGQGIGVTLAANRTLTLGGTLAASGDISLAADRIVATGGSLIAPGTLAIAPVSANAISLAGTAGAHLLLDTTLLGEVNAGTLLIGTTATTTGIAVAGAVDLTGRATALVLATSGAITEPGGPLAVPVLTATAGSGITLGQAANAIGTLDTAQAGTGDLTLTNAADLTLRNAISGQAIAITLDATGGTLALGSGGTAATLAAAGDMTLVADRITEVAGSALTAPGTLTIAPFSANTVSLAGTPGAQLLLDTTLLGAISTTTLVIGDATATTAISVDGTADLTGHAATLDLLSAGSIAEPGGPLIVGTLLATAATGIALGAGNSIGTLGSATVTGGGLFLNDATALTVAGPVGAASVTLASAGSLDVLAAVNAAGLLRLSSGAGMTIASTAPLGAGAIALNSTGTLDVAAGAAATGVLSFASGGAMTVAATAPLNAGTISLDSTGSLSLAAGATASGALGLTAGAGMTIASTSSLNGGSVVLSSTGPLDVRAAGTATGLLSYGATGALTIAATAPVSAGTIALSSGGTLALAAAASASGPLSISGAQVTIASAGSLSASSITLTSTGTLDVEAGATATGALGFTSGAAGMTIAATAPLAGGSITLASSGPLDLEAAATAGGALSLSGAGLTIATTAPLTGGSVTLASTGTLSVAATVGAAGALSATSGGDMLIASTASLAGTSITLASSGALDDEAGATAAAGLSFSAATGLTVGSAAPIAAGSATLTSGGTLGMAAAASVTNDLTLSAGGALTLAGTGSLTAASITVASAAQVAVAGGIGASGQLVLSGAGGVALTGTAPVSGAAMQINGGTGGITLAGTGLIGSAATTLDLIGSGGVTQASTSTIQAALLASSLGITGPVSLGGTANAIAALGAFAVTGGDVVLADGGAGTLTVGGPLTAANITLGSPGGRPATIEVTGSAAATGTLALAATSGITLAAGATLDGAAVTFTTGGPIALLAGAGVGDPAATVSFSSTSGNLREDTDARITAATLTSATGIAGAADFLGTANAITRVQNLAAGGLQLADAVPNLTLAGLVTSGGATVIGTVARPETITLAGTLGGVSVTLNAGGGGLQLNGTLLAPGGIAELNSTGGILQSGLLTAATLQSTGVVGTARFANTNIGTLGSFLVDGGGLTLANAADLVLAGPVSADGIAITAGGGVTVTGTLATPTTLALTTTRGNIELGLAGGTALLIADTVALNAAGQIGEPNGAISAANLTLSGRGAADLGNGGNSITTLGAVTVQDGNFRLRDDAVTTLTIAGPVTASGVAIGTPQTIAIAGRITASTVSLAAGSTIVETGGVLTVGRLDAVAADGITLGNAGNAVAGLGTVTVTNGDLVLVDDAAASLTVAGPVTATNIAIGTPGTLSITGALTDATQTVLAAGAGGIRISGSITAGDLVLVTPGVITEPGGGITAAALSGSAGGALLTGTNTIGEITSFTAGLAFDLADTSALRLAGTLSAPLIDITMPTATFTLADGAAIVTGGTAQPGNFVLLDTSLGAALALSGQVPSAKIPAQAAGQPVGAYLTVGSFVQLGVSTINSLTAGGDSILSIQATGPGTISFADLKGLSTWLLLGLENGNATGTIFVRSLTVLAPVGGGSAQLAGEVNQITGQAAAGAATVLPLPSNQFNFNNCPIRSVNCVLLPVGSAPPRNPLENFALDALITPNDDDNLLLPIVSNKDY